MKFIDSLFVEYPVPQELSIWCDNMYSKATSSLPALIEMCVDALASDVMLPETVRAQGMTTVLPSDAESVCSVKLDFNFQGNKYVKFSWDKSSKKVYTKFYPALITYRRKITVKDLDTMQGDLLQYVRYFVLGKMAEKELLVLSSVKVSTDTASVDTSALSSFLSTCHSKYDELKKGIHLYTVTF